MYVFESQLEDESGRVIVSCRGKSGVSADMLGKCGTPPLCLKLLMPGIAMIGKGENAYPAARHEKPAHFDILRVHQPTEIFHDDIDTILMEVSVIAE